MNELMHIDYGKLAEQYASFLSALGGVSITVLTLVLSLDSLRKELKQADGGENLRPAEVEPGRPNYRPHLIAALIVATVTCFVGAHLMAETASFVNSFISGQAIQGSPGVTKPLGERLFLLASINIYIAVTVVIFALMLLTAEYKRSNDNVPGVRRISMCVFCAVVLCILCWMVVSATLRMPPQNWERAELLPIAAVALLGLALWLKLKHRLWNYLVPASFISIISFTVISLGWFAVSLHWGYNGATTEFDIALFVTSVFSTCMFLLASGKRLILDKHDASLWPVSDEVWQERERLAS